MVRPKKAAKPGKKAVKKDSRRAQTGSKDERHALKLQQRRKKALRAYAEHWDEPAPSHLVARLDVPKVKSKYQSYFEFADNTEKKKKKLEFQVTTNARPPPGFAFVPIGDPALTKACKELSRERDALIFIVSTSKEENSKIAEHVQRTGYHFREMIVEEAREIVGETIISRPAVAPGFIEPIPDSQDEINKQADAAIRDLFPRIPNTDRTMIIEHAFKKGALFHGEPTVGLQASIPLSRRVQLAVLAHIRHTHTRYDKLLRETTWMNARKVVEPVCLDVLVKWRGDEETGRDQMDEILREVVIITDSEEDEEDEEESSDDSSEEDGEVTSPSSTEASPQPLSRMLVAPAGQKSRQLTQGMRDVVDPIPVLSSRTGTVAKIQDPRDKKAQRGFKRYQAAWEDAVHRKHAPPGGLQSHASDISLTTRRPASRVDIMHQGYSRTFPSQQPRLHAMEPSYKSATTNRYHPEPVNVARPSQYHANPSAVPATSLHMSEMTAKPLSDHPAYFRDVSPYFGKPSLLVRDRVSSQVASSSPVKHGFQDLLLPSIETSSSDTLARAPVRSEISSNWENPSNSARGFGTRRQSPIERQVIVIEDSPQFKRRRVIQDGASDPDGHNLSRDMYHYTRHQHPNTSLVSASPVNPEAFHRPSPNMHPVTRQSWLTRPPASWTTSVGTENLPIYDAPESGFFVAHPSQLGKPEVGYSSVHGGVQGDDRYIAARPPAREVVHGSGYHPRPVVDYQREYVRQTEPSHYSQQIESRGNAGNHLEKPLSPRVQNLVRPSHPGQGYGFPLADQDFVQSFSNSRLDDRSNEPDGRSNVATQRQTRDYATNDVNRQPYDSRTSGNMTSSRHYDDRDLRLQEDSPRYTQRVPASTHYTNPSISQHHVSPRQAPFPVPGVPTYVRGNGSKRNVIVIE